MTPMAQEEFLADTENRCPFCRAEEPTFLDWEYGTGAYYDCMLCDACGKQWAEIYKLVRYEERTS